MEEVDITAELTAMELACLPRVFVRLGVASFQFVEYKSTAVEAARSANFPEIRVGHSLEIGDYRAKLRAMEDGFTLNQLVENAEEPQVGNQVGFLLRTHAEMIGPPNRESSMLR